MPACRTTCLELGGYVFCARGRVKGPNEQRVKVGLREDRIYMAKPSHNLAKE